MVQWAKGLGARVIGTVSTEEKARTVREAGADDAIIYTQQDFAAETMRLTGGHGADLVLDSVGKTTFAKSLEAAAVRGHVVCCGSASGPADPILPNALMVKALSVSGGSMANFMRTREEVLWRAGEVISAVQRGDCVGHRSRVSVGRRGGSASSDGRPAVEWEAAARD